MKSWFGEDSVECNQRGPYWSYTAAMGSQLSCIYFVRRTVVCYFCSFSLMIILGANRKGPWNQAPISYLIHIIFSSVWTRLLLAVITRDNAKHLKTYALALPSVCSWHLVRGLPAFWMKSRLTMEYKMSMERAGLMWNTHDHLNTWCAIGIIIGLTRPSTHECHNSQSPREIYVNGNNYCDKITSGVATKRFGLMVQMVKKSVWQCIWDMGTLPLAP